MWDNLLRVDWGRLIHAYGRAHDVPKILMNMVSLDEQTRLPEAFTADFTVVRALLQRGRAYDKAVESFEPYREIQQPSEEARVGMRQFVEHALNSRKSAYLFVNNRLEGNAPSTIEAVVGRLTSSPTAR